MAPRAAANPYARARFRVAGTLAAAVWPPGPAAAVPGRRARAAVEHPAAAVAGHAAVEALAGTRDRCWTRGAGTHTGRHRAGRRGASARASACLPGSAGTAGV